MANGTTLTFPVESTTDPRKWKIVRPTTLGWNDLQTNIRPVIGQKIRIRETAEVTFSRSDSILSSMIWDNRFTREAFLGHFQVTRVNPFNVPNIVTERGTMIGTEIAQSLAFAWHFQREYDLDLFLNKTDKNAAFLTAITNCNADLAPGPVPNNFINSDNVIAYIRSAFGISVEDVPNAQTLLDALNLPVVSGYRFPNTTLFRGINNIPSINLDGYEISTRLGDLELWVHPDWIIDSIYAYTFEVIHYNILDDTIEQFPDGESCSYPSTISFP